METTKKCHGEHGWQARLKAYLWPGVSCDQTLQDQCIPLPNCINTFTDVVFLHHARLPSMDDLCLSRSCGEETRGKKGKKQHPSPLHPLPRVAAPMAGWKSHLLSHRGEEPVLGMRHKGLRRYKIEQFSPSPRQLVSSAILKPLVLLGWAALSTAKQNMELFGRDPPAWAENQEFPALISPREEHTWVVKAGTWSNHNCSTPV